MGIIEDIKGGIEASSLAIGKHTVLKQLKAGRLSKVIVASNCDPRLLEDVRRLCGTGEIECIESELNAKDLGAICKKSFGISILGFVV
jgi:ribosomal protein L30E